MNIPVHVEFLCDLHEHQAIAREIWDTLPFPETLKIDISRYTQGINSIKAIADNENDASETLAWIARIIMQHTIKGHKEDIEHII